MYEKTGRYPVPVTRGRGGIRGRGRGFVPRGRGRGVGRFQSKRVFCFFAFLCVFFFQLQKDISIYCNSSKCIQSKFRVTGPFSFVF